MSRYRRKQKNKIKKSVPLWIKILIALFMIFIISGIAVAGAIGGIAFTTATAVASFIDDLPDLEEYAPTQGALTSKIYASDGTLIATFHGEENRELVGLKEMPKNLINAVISIEDERFYKHRGVDFEGIVRAFLINLQSGEIVEGASTITQQVVTSVYIPQGKTIVTYDRKIKEAALAYQLEKIYTKDEILEMYLNTIYLGEGAYGVQAAAKVYFNKDVEYLSLSECATIAGLIQSPGYLSPYINKKASLKRRNIVLDKMLELGYINQKDYENAINSSINPQRPFQETEKGFAPYFVEYVKQILIEKYGVNKVFKGGFNIYTTLDPTMQVAAEDSINQILYDPEDPAAALVAMDPKTGYIKAMVGGKDFGDMKFNLATQAKRQPGSTFKVFALIAALEQGVSPYITFNPNGTLIYDIVGSEPWKVSNYEGTRYDTNEMTLLDGTVGSVNVVYAQLIMKIGGYIVSKVANDMGIETPLEGFPAIGLGGLTTGVSALEVCNSFATIANYGAKHEPIAILKVTDKDGKTIDEFKPESKQVISAINAYRAIEIMKQVMQRGTGTRAKLADRPCAGKTGTTQEAENAWFTGFTTNLAACVWMGYPEVNKKMGVIHDMRVQGGAQPAMIWKLFMERATANLPVEDFVKPEDTTISVQITVNPETGEVAVPNRFTPSEQITMANYKYGSEPRTQAPILPEDIPLLPNVTLMPMADANNILFQAGYTHVEFIREPYAEVPPGYTHRMDPMFDTPVERIRNIKVWYNP
ncbi:MAG: Penicillin-binding protein 2D [Actinobacteria bacterium ADurb.Bin346]|nr:MAG: Penicillin-binding protein 2D [Actinobacteria bacterium ADurb.Bin346]